MTIGLVPAPGEEQSMLLDASIRFMEDTHPLATVRQHADGAVREHADGAVREHADGAVREHADGPASLSPAYRETAGALGWFGLLAAEDHGGGAASGNGVLDAALIAAERGARLQPGPFVGHSVTVAALSAALADPATSGAAARTIAGLIAGGAWATWAFEEAPSVQVHDTPDGMRLTGRVSPVADAAACGWLLVTARGARGTTQVLVSTDTPGVAIRPLEGLDVSRSWSSVVLDGATGFVIGSPGSATDAAVATQAQLAAVLGAAETVGAMYADFALALQYAKDRIAFGRPIGSFQAIKHILADVSLGLEMSMATVVAAATALGSGGADGPQLAHAAKAFVAEKGMELAHSCFQVFGGIGYTWEHDQHLYFRRIATDIASFGRAEWHRARVLDHGLLPQGAPRDLHPEGAR